MDEIQAKLQRSLAANCLSLILFPSERCNFRCTYCYEDSGPGRMDNVVFRGLKKFLKRRAEDLDLLTIAWFGGEPLLALDLVRETMEYIQSLLKENPRIHFSANMTTNAYLLTESLFQELLALGITGYQITFDGPKDHHDRKRIHANGKGTFDRIWRNVNDFKKVPGRFQVVIRVHVDGENKDAVPEFINQCGDAFIDDDRFKIFIRPLSRLGGPNDNRLCILKGGMNDEAIVNLKRMAGAQGLTLDEDKNALKVCYASMANSFCIRADGRVNKCTVALHHPGNQVGRLSEHGKLELDKTLMLKWMRGLGTGDKGALQCPMINFPVD